jgi:hypothetical protein
LPRSEALSTSSRSKTRVVLQAVAELFRERDALARRVEVLDGKLVEVTDLLANGKAERAAYVRGYSAGYKAKRRGKRTMVPRGADPTELGVSEAA